MRIVKIEGRDLELIRVLLGHLATATATDLEVAVDSEGFKVRVGGTWTPGYGRLLPATRVRVTNDPDDDPPSIDELIARADIIVETEEGRRGRGTD